MFSFRRKTLVLLKKENQFEIFFLVHFLNKTRNKEKKNKHPFKSIKKIINIKTYMKRNEKKFEIFFGSFLKPDKKLSKKINIHSKG